MFISEIEKREFIEMLDQWAEDPLGVKSAFLVIHDKLLGQAGTVFSFISRPGVSYSLRASIKDIEDSPRPYYALVDIVDQPGSDRWLSVCFYGDSVTDPEELGNLIPQGLLNEDGYCFDVEKYDDNLLAYIGDRIREAYENTIAGIFKRKP